ncbi:beta strand repeat-containing protein [Haloferula chungangensis]|uniref:Beta strand repeat-containing protein n=1 Tax=Haloferula chungangensis TaxID=1048331 RepID=A0ABW2L8K3_9BACT
MNKIVLTIAVSACAPLALGTDYTWTGAAGDGDWNNELNWEDIVANDGVPVDDATAAETGFPSGLSMPAGDRIIFSGSSMPTTNIPAYGGLFDNNANLGANSSPALVLNSGGTISFTHMGRESGIWTNLAPAASRQIFTVGDGAGPAGEVGLTITGTQSMNRHNNGEHIFRVNADGVLTLSSNLGRWGYSALRPASILIDGGTVVMNDDFPTGANSNVNAGAVQFLSTDGTFTANYGGAFPDITSVRGAFGSVFQTDVPDTILLATDNAGTSFTISVADPSYWTGNGGATWDQDTTVNFTTNPKSGALTEGTFAAATASTMTASFADYYIANDTEVDVSVNNITVATGGVSGRAIRFENSALSYTIDSSDANGIADASSVSITQGGTVTLRGTHAYSGPTNVGAGSTLALGDGTMDGFIDNSPIFNEGSLVIDLAGSGTRIAAINGLGTVEKRGDGNLILPATSPYDGPTVVSGGTLTFPGIMQTDSIQVASGATVEFNAAAAQNSIRGNVTISGSGTILKTGASTVVWTNEIATYELDSNAVIDVQEGIFRGGSNANDVWVNNASNLNIGFAGQFQTNEAKVRINSLTGEGLLTNGSGHAYYEPLRIGVANGSGVFDGVIAAGGANSHLIKMGTGSQTLNGSNSFTGFVEVEGGELILNGPNVYTGNTTVGDATFKLGIDGTMTFVPAANNVTNQIVGTGDNTTGVVDLDGAIYIDLTNAAAGVGNSWTLIDPTNLSSVDYDQSTFVVDSPIGYFDYPDGDGIWRLEDGIALWEFDENTGVLSYSVGADARLWVGNDPTNPGLWDQATTANFSINEPSDPLMVSDYTTAQSEFGTIGFADGFFDSGTSIGVTQNVVTIAAGGISGELVEFVNSNLPYTIVSSDDNGISGTTNVNIGGGSVTMVGNHASTGTTTLNGTLIFDTTLGDANYFAALTGNGGIEKVGAGTQTLSGPMSFTGATTVTAGTLVAPGDSSSAVATIAADATLELNFNGRWGEGAATISGGGTLVKLGDGTLDFQALNFAMGSGSLIDVQAGVFKGGSGTNENWTGNLSDLNIAAGAAFTTVEEPVVVDVLTGDGILATGLDHGHYTHLTIGVDGGSGSFGGDVVDHGVWAELGPGLHYGGMHKVGAGTQTFTGDVALHDDITIEEGSVILDVGGSISFFPTANMTTNVVNGGGVGSGSVTINGAINFDLSGADTTTGNTWTILDPTLLGGGVTIGAEAYVTSNLGVFGPTEDPDLVELDAGGFLWSFRVSTVTLSVAPGTPVGFTNWLNSYPDLVDTSENGDEDLDGLENVLEYLFDGNPTVSDAGNPNLPRVDASGDSFVFTFTRNADSTNDTTQIFQYGSDLAGWTDIAVNTDAAPEVVIAAPVNNLETVTVTVAKSSLTDQSLAFGRLAVTLNP